MTRATIDLDALRRNIDTLTTRVAPARLMVMVKANAYGHGLVPVATAAVASGVRLLGVLDAESGLTLRSSGVGGEVRLFAWLFGPEEDYRALVDADIDLGISHLHQLERIARSGAGAPARLHLKIDTGLHRNGASVEEWPGLVARALELQTAGVVELVGGWTHISEASDEDDSIAIDRFRTAIGVAAGLGARFSLLHLAASAAGFARADSRFDAVRVGAFCYGIAPGGGVCPADIGIEPVMTLSAPVVSVTTETTTEITTEMTAERTREIARVAIGFVDGIPGQAAGRVEIAINGVRFPVVRVGAAFLEADVTGTTVGSGATAVMFGTGHAGEPTLQEWADALGTIGEELVVRLSPRLQRDYR